MSKNEFLKKLEEALENDLSVEQANYHVGYYREYIEEEVRKGRKEEEVLDELGDPWLVAKNLIEVPREEGEIPNREERKEGQRETEDSNERRAVFTSQGGCLLLLLGILVGAIVLGIVVFGAVKLLFPILFPIAIVIWIVRVFFNQRRR